MPIPLINVSNRLPITLDGNDIKKSSGGLVAALEGLSDKEYEAKWIGWPGGVVEPAKQEEITRRLVDEQGCTPVFLTEEEAEAHYEGFSNSSVWPLLHYMPDYLRYEPEWWEAYHKINQRFADKVLETAPDDALVWVHDYQLLLVAGDAARGAADPADRVLSCTRRFRPTTCFAATRVGGNWSKGCSARTCWGSTLSAIYGIFAARFCGCWEWRRTSRTSVPPTAAGPRIRRVPHRHPRAEVRRDARPVSPRKTRQEKFRQTFQGKQIVLSVERMDYTKGILHRLKAVDYYLAGLEDRDGIKFIFVSVPVTRGRRGIPGPARGSRVAHRPAQRQICDACTTVRSISSTGRSNSPTSAHCIPSPTRDFVTPLVDGMNLVAKEFLACQRDRFAPLILSEFAGRGGRARRLRYSSTPTIRRPLPEPSQRRWRCLPTNAKGASGRCTRGSWNTTRRVGRNRLSMISPRQRLPHRICNEWRRARRARSRGFATFPRAGERGGKPCCFSITMGRCARLVADPVHRRS